MLAALLSVFLGGFPASDAHAAGRDLDAAVDDLAAQTAARLPEKSRLVVSEIYDRDGRLTYFGRFFGEKLQASLVHRKPGLVVLERRRLDLLVDELQLQQTGLMDPASVLKTGRLLGADTIVHGVVADLEKTIDVDLTLRRVETGEVIGAASARIQKTEELAALLHSILLNERQRNEAERLGETDRGRLDALEKDNERLKEALRTGVWRGGPAFEPVPVERAGLSTQAWSWRLFGGYAYQDVDPHPVWNAGFGLRLPSERWEVLADVSRYEHQAHYFTSETAAGAPGILQVDRTFTYQVWVARFRGAYLHPLRRIGFPGVAHFSFPGFLRLAAGAAVYDVRMDKTWSTWGGAQNYESSSDHYLRVEPLVELTLSRALNNVFDLQACLQYTAVLHPDDIGSNFDYGGLAIGGGVAYRFY